MKRVQCERNGSLLLLTTFMWIPFGFHLLERTISISIAPAIIQGAITAARNAPK